MHETEFRLGPGCRGTLLVALYAYLATAPVRAQSPVLVKDIGVGTASVGLPSAPGFVVEFGSAPYLALDTPATGEELFTSDGLTAWLVAETIRGGDIGKAESQRS